MHSTTPSRGDTTRLCRWQYYTMKKKVSRQHEGSNSTFQKIPAKTRVRIQLFKSFPPKRVFELTFQKFPAKTRVRIQLEKGSRQDERHQQCLAFTDSPASVNPCTMPTRRSTPLSSLAFSVDGTLINTQQYYYVSCVTRREASVDGRPSPLLLYFTSFSATHTTDFY
jgi:hypothetical protein